ncbi:hypothetical protein C0991_001639 [Blastosporella zonata]|nr:hypothetical protein C0991_001639 [Blastosporella zonata]
MDSSSKSSDISEKRIEDVRQDIEQASLDDDDYPPELVKKTLRQIDLRMLPLLGLLYSIALIDRTNLGIARVAGMQVDLRLDLGDRYSIASCLYFVPYIILQLPSNVVLRWLGARTWLTICVTGWGVAQLGMGFVPKWGYLVLCRVFLGIFEVTDAMSTED